MNYYSKISDLKSFNWRRFTIILSVLFLIAYGLFNARCLLLGPTIELFNPSQDLETGEGVLTIKGRAQNIAFISLNEKPIYIDTDGIFQDKLLLSPGSNIIEVKAKDRFQNETVKQVKVYYKEGTAASEI